LGEERASGNGRPSGRAGLGGSLSVHRAGRLRREQLLDRREDAEPHVQHLDVPGREQCIRLLRCPDWCVGAVLID
jgi:hypothetical protein